MEKQDFKQATIIEDICDELKIDVELLLNEDLVKRFSETTLNELDKGLFFFK